MTTVLAIALLLAALWLLALLLVLVTAIAIHLRPHISRRPR